MSNQEFIPIVKPILPEVTDSLKTEIGELINSGMLSKGKYLRELESEIAEYLGVEHAIATSSCTLGLLLSYSGLGLQKDDEVLVPSFTFMATVHPLMWLGVKPIFTDIDKNTWNISVDAVEQSITNKTTGIVAVHNFGNPAPIRELENIAKKYNLKLIFDSAHGFGTLYEGNQVGRFGDAEIFSLSPTKLLVAGEGGVVATNNEELAEHIKLGREYGNAGDYGSEFAGLNARLPEFNAMLALRGLSSIDQHAINRNEIATKIRNELNDVEGLEFQHIRSVDRSSYKDLNINVDKKLFGMSRDELSEFLRSVNIDTRKYHYPAVHTHRTYRQLYAENETNLVNTNSVAHQCLSIPIWSKMDNKVVYRITEAILNAYNN